MLDMNFELARFNMVEQQVRTWEVLDARVLDEMRRIPREDFVPQQYRKLAFNDMEIPLGHGEVMMAPKMVGRMLQALKVKPTDNVLEVGTGSGYTTALLASLASESKVWSVDISAELTRAAKTRLAKHAIQNVSLENGDALNGWNRHAPYDVIAINGSLPELHGGFQAFRDSLSVGGRLFVVVGESPTMEAQLITRLGEQEWKTESLFETVVPALKGAVKTQIFQF